MFVTPNTLTEASHLIAKKQDTRFMNQLGVLVENSVEIVVASKTAAHNKTFVKLGLTDAVLLETVSPERPLITVDFDLCGAASAKGRNVSFNFTHFLKLCRRLLRNSKTVVAAAFPLS